MIKNYINYLLKLFIIIIILFCIFKLIPNTIIKNNDLSFILFIDTVVFTLFHIKYN